MKADTRDQMILAGIVVFGVWFVSRTVSRTVSAIPRALRSAGEAIGSGLFDFFHPDQVGEMLFYTVQFPDGRQHAVPSRAVSRDGRFIRERVTYQLLAEKEPPHRKFAVKVSI